MFSANITNHHKMNEENKKKPFIYIKKYHLNIFLNSNILTCIFFLTFYNDWTSEKTVIFH